MGDEGKSMTFYFDDETGVMAIAFVEGAVGPCMYFETAIGVFRVERDTNKLVSVTIPFFFEKLADQQAHEVAAVAAEKLKAKKAWRSGFKWGFAAGAALVGALARTL